MLERAVIVQKVNKYVELGVAIEARKAVFEHLLPRRSAARRIGFDVDVIAGEEV